jgi:hypothetical protein
MCLTPAPCPDEAACARIDWTEATSLDVWKNYHPCPAGDDLRSCCPRLAASCGKKSNPRCDLDQGVAVEQASCDDSRDCAAGICCTVGPQESSVCAPPAQCEGWERCRDDAGCKTPGARCVRGRCRSTRGHVRCGDGECRGATPVCQFPDWRVKHPPGPASPPRCVAWEAVHHGSDFLECTSGRDCPDGERCVWTEYVGDGRGEWSVTTCRFSAMEGIAPRTHTCDADSDCADLVGNYGIDTPLHCASAAVDGCLHLCAQDAAPGWVQLPGATSKSACDAGP